MLSRPRDYRLEREIARDIEAVHRLQTALARESKAELDDFVARFGGKNVEY